MGVLEKEPRLNRVMEQMPTNLTLDKSNCDTCERAINDMKVETAGGNICNKSDSPGKSRTENVSETKIQLSFSVDRLLNDEQSVNGEAAKEREQSIGKCDNTIYCCCAYPNCLIGGGVGVTHEIQHTQQFNLKTYQNCNTTNEVHNKIYHGSLLSTSYMDFKSVVRPTPIRALGNNCEPVPLHAPFSAMPPNALMRFQQHKSANAGHPPLMPMPTVMNTIAGLKTLHGSQMPMQAFAANLVNRFPAKAHSLADIPVATTSSLNSQHTHHFAVSQQQLVQQPTPLQHTTGNGSGSNNGNGSAGGGSANNGGKRKRSWSRAVFSNLQRKGLEIQFQQQKYITKPDRRKLAARLNLTDAQVKVWFQNRRMKWRHTRENLKSGQEKQVSTAAAPTANNAESEKSTDGERQRELGYSTDDSSSVEMSEHEDDDEIDVVE